MLNSAEFNSKISCSPVCLRNLPSGSVGTSSIQGYETTVHFAAIQKICPRNQRLVSTEKRNFSDKQGLEPQDSNFKTCVAPLVHIDLCVTDFIIFRPFFYSGLPKKTVSTRDNHFLSLALALTIHNKQTSSAHNGVHARRVDSSTEVSSLSSH